MAKTKTSFVNPLEPLGKAASRFKEQTLMQLKANTITQTVFPVEVYPGYTVINESRKATGSWFSTGDGVNSFDGKVVNASDIRNLVMEFSYLQYLDFAELGVGKGRPAETVQRAKKARYKNRYINKWVAKMGKTHRPFLSMELRHLATRLDRYALDFYGYEAQFRIMDMFDGMQVDLTAI